MALKEKLVEGAWELLQKGLGMEFSRESKANLESLNQLLITDSAVVYINHTSKIDVILGASLVVGGLTNAKRIISPVGMKHYDLSRKPVDAVLLRSLKLVNIHALPVVQVSDTWDYGENQQEMIDELKRQTELMLGLPGSVYGIAPEGTRNKIDGTLQRANRGIGYLERYGVDIYYVPISLVYKKYSDQPEVAVGTPLQLDEIIPVDLDLPSDPKERAQVIGDTHMMRLAELLPEDLRGVYA